MQFIIISITALVLLGVVAALTSLGTKDETIVKAEGDCSSCTGRDECKIACLMAEKEKQGHKSHGKDNKTHD
jgi:hypothetical protein